MDATLIVMLGLPVLYVTGSLKKEVANARISGVCFVLYFLCAAALSLIPRLQIVPAVSLSLQGAFFCIAPATYLAAKRRYNYQFYFCSALMVLLAVSVTFFLGSYTLPYLPYPLGLLISLIAVLCFKALAPVFAPMLIGMYGIAESIMQMLTGSGATVWFGDIKMTSVSVVLCIFTAYYVTRPRGKHSPHGRRKENPAT